MWKVSKEYRVFMKQCELNATFYFMDTEKSCFRLWFILHSVIYIEKEPVTLVMWSFLLCQYQNSVLFLHGLLGGGEVSFLKNKFCMRGGWCPSKIKYVKIPQCWAVPGFFSLRTSMLLPPCEHAALGALYLVYLRVLLYS